MVDWVVELLFGLHIIGSSSKTKVPKNETPLRSFLGCYLSFFKDKTLILYFCLWRSSCSKYSTFGHSLLAMHSLPFTHHDNKLLSAFHSLFFMVQIANIFLGECLSSMMSTCSAFDGLWHNQNCPCTDDQPVQILARVLFTWRKWGLLGILQLKAIIVMAEVWR